MDLADPMLKSFSSKSVPKKLRRRVMATWTKDLTDAPSEWISEFQQRARPDETEPKYVAEMKMTAAMAAKQAEISSAENVLKLEDCKRRLQDLVVSRYGSVKAMFNHMDADKSGSLSLNEFSEMLKRRNMEMFFPRTDQRVIFAKLDRDNNDSVDLKEFEDFLQPDPHRLGSSSEPSPPEAPQLNDRLMSIRESIIQRVHAARDKAKQLHGKDQYADHLMRAFFAFDDKMLGSLTRPEMHAALGPQHLNLGLPKTDVDELIDAMDYNHDQRVSYKEFVKFLQINDMDPAFNPFYDSRERQVRTLEKLSTAPWKFQAQTDEAKRKFDELSQTRSLDLAEKDYLEQLEEQRATVLSGMLDDTAQGPVVPDLRQACRRPSPRLAHPIPRTAEDQRAAMNTSSQLFGEMQTHNQQKMAAICPRFVAAPPTRWDRIGYGGDGVDATSGLFLPRADRFRTTNSTYFSALRYEPNQPVVRDTLSDAALASMRTKARVASLQAQRTVYSKRVEDRVKAEQLAKEMDMEQRLKTTAGQMHGYLTSTFSADLKSLKREPPEAMQRRPNPKLADRMWAGSQESMLHPKHQRGQPYAPDHFLTEHTTIGRDVHLQEKDGNAHLGRLLMDKMKRIRAKEAF